MASTVIIDYGLGNLGSIANMIKKNGFEAIISSDLETIANADKLILPGVGAFDNGMKNLNDTGIRDMLDKKVIEEKKPILGICLGMQLFTQRSEEGVLPGLCWIKAETRKFALPPGQVKLRIPHMGWNTVSPKKESRIFSGFEDDPQFYFVHSYRVECFEQNDIAGVTDYGGEFTSAVERGNIIGVQFHPEKSHTYGTRLLKNFLEKY